LLIGKVNRVIIKKMSLTFLSVKKNLKGVKLLNTIFEMYIFNESYYRLLTNL
jgi:hypothetical protein